MAEVAARERTGAETPGKHDLIVAAARKLFLGSGYGAVSMDAIALEAGVSKRTVYSHFQNKESLFAAVIGAMCHEFGGPSPDDLVAEGSPEVVLRAVARRILGVVLRPEALSVFRVVLSESPQFPELSRLFCATGPGPMENALTEFFAGLDREGTLRVADPEVAGRQFIGMIKGPYLLPLLFGVGERPSNDEIERTIDQAVDTFLNGLRADPR